MKKLYTLALALLTAGTAMAQANITQADFVGVLVPQYMGSGASTRLPVAYRARLTNLTPNSTYQFRTTLGISSDLGTANNTAGNSLFINDPTRVLYTTSQSLQPNRSGSFMTDANGTYTGWFATVYTGNSRFAAGNDIYPIISLNGGTGAAGDTTVQKRLALDATIKVLTFGNSGANSGTGIYGASQAAPKNFVALFDNEAGTGRPLAVTPVQALGFTITTWASFYASNVDGQAGAWGAIIPNDLASGVRRIALYENQTGNEIAFNTSSGGTWGNTNTVSPSGGTTALAISATDAPLVTGLLRPVSAPLIAVSPNPAQHTLTLEGLMPNENIEVRDVTGRIHSVTSPLPGLINVENLKPGTYFITTSRGRLARFTKVQ